MRPINALLFVFLLSPSPLVWAQTEGTPAIARDVFSREVRRAAVPPLVVEERVAVPPPRVVTERVVPGPVVRERVPLPATVVERPVVRERVPLPSTVVERPVVRERVPLPSTVVERPVVRERVPLPNTVVERPVVRERVPPPATVVERSVVRERVAPPVTVVERPVVRERVVTTPPVVATSPAVHWWDVLARARFGYHDDAYFDDNWYYDYYEAPPLATRDTDVLYRTGWLYAPTAERGLFNW